MMSQRWYTLVGFVALFCPLLACESAPLPPPASPTGAPPAAASTASLAESSAAAPATSASATAATGSLASTPAPWWDTPYPSRFDATRLPKHPSAIRVEKNHFVNEAGTTVVFQGVSIADPDKLVREGHWNRALFEAIHSWGANVVRVPIHPAAYRGIGRQEYFKLIDQAVLWGNELDLYLIIDWHSIGNLATGMFQHTIYDTTKSETYEFWRGIAYRYQHIPTVAMLELFNEPTDFRGQLGTITWAQWKTINEELIDIIRKNDNTAIPLVAGFDWAYDLAPVAKDPVKRPGIAYVSHPYPMKTTRPFEQKWDKTFGFIAAKYPLIATEIGYMPPDAKGAHVPVKDDGTYGKLITDYLAKKGASWVAWCFHPDWAPPLIADWTFKPTGSGEHFRSVMLARSSTTPTPAGGAAASKAAPATVGGAAASKAAPAPAGGATASKAAPKAKPAPAGGATAPKATSAPSVAAPATK